MENGLKTRELPLVVYGPAGCGKTRNARPIAKLLGARFILDEWNCGTPLQFDTVHFTNDPAALEIHPSRTLLFEDLLKELKG